MKPERLRLEPDQFHLRHAGRTNDGRQYWLTTAFVAYASDYLAFYLFDLQGRLLEAEIDDLGPRETGRFEEDVEMKRFESLSEELGLTVEAIEVAPFSIEQFGVQFGLIPRPDDDDPEVWYVEAHPGSYLSFYEPWDGSYDT
jgi:hypothetical protein